MYVSSYGQTPGHNFWQKSEPSRVQFVNIPSKAFNRMMFTVDYLWKPWIRFT